LLLGEHVYQRLLVTQEPLSLHQQLTIGAYSMHIHAIRENNGTIGQWFIFEKTNNLGDKVENYYPSRLLGFITTNGTHEAVIQCSINPIDWGVIQ
jgi:hypothetical protein